MPERVGFEAGAGITLPFKACLTTATYLVLSCLTTATVPPTTFPTEPPVGPPTALPTTVPRVLQFKSLKM